MLFTLALYLTIAYHLLQDPAPQTIATEPGGTAPLAAAKPLDTLDSEKRGQVLILEFS